MKVFLLAALMLLLLRSESQRIPAFAGPFKVLVKHLTSCPVEKRGLDLWAYSLHEKSPGRSRKDDTPIYDINVTILADMTEDMRANVQIASWSNTAGWRENAHVLKLPNVCRALEDYVGAQWSSVLNIVFGEQIRCPLKKGYYRYVNGSIDGTIKKVVTHFVYGKWRVDLQPMRKTGEVLGCLRCIADTVPNLQALKQGDKGKG